MILVILELLLMLAIILAASELFTNALEHIGDKLNVSQGVTGSLLAAVGTALPETMVPLMAIFAGGAVAEANTDVGIGAILGAPLMLCSLAPFILALTLVGPRGWNGRVTPEPSGFRRDLDVFLVAFVVAAAAMLVPPTATPVRIALALLLVLIYAGYVARTLYASADLVAGGHGTDADERLHATRIGLPDRLATTLLQVLAALAFLIAGAKGFVHGVQALADALGMATLLISLLVIPIATELPEKVNSILWTRRGKDTLAIGNLTGAMVFQGTLLPAIGIVLTPWSGRFAEICVVIATLTATLWLRLSARANGTPVWALACSGMIYVAFVTATLLGE